MVSPLPRGSSVVILGAGISGLTAGLLLDNLGYNVTILEARDVVGGRLLTIRDGFEDGLFAEGGGTYLHLRHSIGLGLFENRGLTKERVNMGLLPTVYLVGGKRIIFPAPDGEAIDWPFDFTPQERQLGPNGMSEKYTSRPEHMSALNPYASNWPPTDLFKMDQITLAEMMEMRGASPAAVDFLSMGFNALAGFGPRSYSALLDTAQDRFLRDHPHGSRIDGGDDLLTKKMAEPLSDRIKLSARAQNISQTRDNVSISVSTRGVTSQMQADCCLCTIPFSVLRDIAFDPPLPDQKATAVSTFPYTSVTRIYCQFREDFWTPKGLSGLAITSLPGVVIYSDFGFFAGRGGILEVYTAGQIALQLSRLRHAEREAFALQQIAAAFPGYSRANLVTSVSKSWDEDPFARGGYTWFLPGQMSRFLGVAVAPFERIFFAGDHCSVLPGWIEGALQSAVHAVERITGTHVAQLKSLLNRV